LAASSNIVFGPDLCVGAFFVAGAIKIAKPAIVNAGDGVCVGVEDCARAKRDVVVTVDPAFPNAWWREPYYLQLRAWMADECVQIRVGLRVITPAGRRYGARDGRDAGLGRHRSFTLGLGHVARMSCRHFCAPCKSLKLLGTELNRMRHVIACIGPKCYDVQSLRRFVSTITRQIIDLQGDRIFAQTNAG
jgi:hypothetical protein